jgi:hypothetical protein
VLTFACDPATAAFFFPHGLRATDGSGQACFLCICLLMARKRDPVEQIRVPRKWNEEFIDAPLVKHQRQPSTTCTGMSDILLFARGQYQVLYALLAGCGPLRAAFPKNSARSISCRRRNAGRFSHTCENLVRAATAYVPRRRRTSPASSARFPLRSDRRRARASTDPG